MKTKFDRRRWGEIFYSEPAQLLREFLSRSEIQRGMVALADAKVPPVSIASEFCETRLFQRALQRSECSINHFKRLSGSLVSDVMSSMGYMKYRSGRKCIHRYGNFFRSGSTFIRDLQRWEANYSLR